MSNLYHLLTLCVGSDEDIAGSEYVRGALEVIFSAIAADLGVSLTEVKTLCEKRCHEAVNLAIAARPLEMRGIYLDLMSDLMVILRRGL